MGRYTFTQNSFTAGEISDKLRLRTDIKEYKNGLTTLDNFIPYKSGGVVKRPGFRIDSNTSSATTGTRDQVTQIPFSFSKLDNYKVFLRLGIDNLGSGIYITDSANNIQNVADINYSVQEALSLVTDTHGLHYAQTGGMLFITHNSSLMPPIIIYKTINPTVGTIQFGGYSLADRTHGGVSFDYAYELDSNTRLSPFLQIPMRDPNTSSATLAVAATALTGTPTTLICTEDLFKTDHVGSYFMIENKASPTQLMVVCEVLTYVDAKNVTAEVVAVSSGAPASLTTDYWYENSWSKVRGWPRTVAIFEGRIYYGGNTDEPDTLWASSFNLYTQINAYLVHVTGNELRYQRVPDAADPIIFSISSTQTDTISWLSSGLALLIGTLTKEYSLSGGDLPVTRDSVLISPQSYTGSSPYMPVNSDNKVYFIARDGNSLHELGYSNDAGRFVSRNMSILSDDLIHEGNTDRGARFVKVVWQQSRSTVWAMTNKNKLYGLTVEVSSEVTAWHKHPMNGLDVYDLMTLPNVDGTFHDLHMLCTHPDQSVNTDILALRSGDNFEHGDFINTSTRDEDKPIFGDIGGVSVVGGGSITHPLTTIALDGITVTVLKDDLTTEEVTIVSNIITLSTASETIYFGIPYTSQLITLNVEVGPNPLLSSQGDIRRIDRATLALYKTMQGKYGTESSDLYDLEISTSEITTELVQVDIPANPGIENKIVVTNDTMFPIALLGLVLRGINNT